MLGKQEELILLVIGFFFPLEVLEVEVVVLGDIISSELLALLVPTPLIDLRLTEASLLSDLEHGDLAPSGVLLVLFLEHLELVHRLALSLADDAISLRLEV